MLLSVAVLLLAAVPAVRADPQLAARLYDKVSPSLVVAQYTYDSEGGRRDIMGLGVVIDPKGIVLTSLGLFPIQIPDAQMRNFRILIPGDEQKELDAVFLGRDERTYLAFLRTKEPPNWPAIKFEDVGVKVGQTVASVGLLPKDAGYKAYYNEATVSAILRGPIPHVLVSPSGLGNVGAPVFDADGKAIGLVAFQQGQSALLGSEARSTAQAVSIPSRFFVPSRDFLMSLSDMPVEGKPLAIPWLGAPLSGLKKELAEHFKLKGQASVMVGDIVENSPAARGGLKPGDIIVKLNGQPLERGDEPDEASEILQRQLRRLKAGTKIVLTVVRQGEAATVDVPVALDAKPREMNLARRFHAEDLGFAVRELVFSDTYARKLPADTKGVVVAFIKQGGSAATGRLANGDLITKLNNTDVKDLDQFQQLYVQTRRQSPREAIVMEVLRERNTEVIRIEPPQ
jgi:serine protease Do